MLLLAAACLILSGAAKLFHTSSVERMLTESIWLENGEYDPKNNGKQVTVLLNGKETKKAFDREMNLEFTEPVIRRKVEVFAYAGESKEGTPQWEWKDTADTWGDEPEYRIISDNEDMLAIDVSFDKLLPTGSDLSMDDLTEESGKTAKNRFATVKKDGKTYFTDAPSICFKENCRGTAYLEYEGCLRLNYTSLVTGKKAIAVTGFQQDQTLIPDQKLKETAVMSLKVKE